MKILVKVKAGAKQEKIEKDPLGGYVVWVRERAQEGKANEAVIQALAEKFGVAPSTISIISGHISNKKIISLGN